MSAGDIDGDAGASRGRSARGTDRRLIALSYGALAHSLFLAGVGAMLLNLHEGMCCALGTAHGMAALAANALLVLQFPIVHSLLLRRRGLRALSRLAPAGLGGDLATTTFSGIAALQLILTFLLWSPSGVVWFRPHGAAAVAMNGLYAASWLFLIKALWDAGLPLQTGWMGWTAVLRGRRPEFAPFPTRGLFSVCRQPVYLGFALTLWTGAVWTPDHLALAVAWTIYCLVGPRFKERRYLERYGEEFRKYQTAVPYMGLGARRAT
jgi:protein-S-isoprenylcysteine O-methyltransferase Ste14